MNRIIFLWVIKVGYFFFFSGGYSGNTDSKIGCQGFINITGNTNIDHFKLRMDSLAPRILKINTYKNTQVSDSSIHNISVPVKGFETANPIFYYDFLTLVKADTYPEIDIGIMHCPLLKIIENEHGGFQYIHISLAGVTNSYRVPVKITRCSGNRYYITGNRTIKLTDFKIIPPERFFGLVKVEDDLFIDFGFAFFISQPGVARAKQGI